MRPRLVLLALALSAAAIGCGGGGRSTSTAVGEPTTATTPPAGAPSGRAAPARSDTRADWPLFGLTAQRPNATGRSSGVNAARLRHLRRIRVSLPGTVDSSPIYLHGVTVRGARRDVFVVTTTYGRTLALNAANGKVLWTFTPPGIGGWEGSAQITNASPAADPGRHSVYAASPNGLVHKLSLATGREVRAGRWPFRMTHDPTHEKLTSSLNISGRLVIAATGGYIGDAPPYQGHVVTIDRRTGRAVGIFNTLCSDRHAIIVPRTCRSSASAIWSRSGPTVVPGTKELLVATGNAPWNGRTDWGDSVLLLSSDARRLLGHWTPPNQAQLADSDTDLGSTSPALLTRDLVLQGGKDARLHVLSLARMRKAGARPVLGGEVQNLPAPGGQVFTAPAVWRHRGTTTVFVATAGATAAYRVSGGRLRLAWQNGTAGTSPVVTGGLLYVQDPNGGLNVYRPSSGRRLAGLDSGAAHWQSPVIAQGRILIAEGDANDHDRTGTLSLYVPSG